MGRRKESSSNVDTRKGRIASYGLVGAVKDTAGNIDKAQKKYNDSAKGKMSRAKYEATQRSKDIHREARKAVYHRQKAVYEAAKKAITPTIP